MLKARMIIVLMVFSLSGYAQLVQTSISSQTHGDEVVNVYEIILDVDKPSAQEYWNDFIEDETDHNIKGLRLFNNKDLLETEMSVFPSIAQFPLKLYMHFDEVGDKTYLKLFAQKEDGKYLNPAKWKDRASFTNLQKFGNDYLEYFLPIYYRENLRDAENLFADTQKELNKVTDEIADYRQEIEQLEEKLREAEYEQANLESKLAKNQRLLRRKKYTYQEIKHILDHLDH
jgi:hypothetical protein